MKFHTTAVTGALLVEPPKKADERGHFSRLFCQKSFAEHNLESNFVQINHSLSKVSGTLRGMHYQLSPYEETKLVKCIRGSLFDVVLDLRFASPTFGQYASAILSAENGSMMYVPKGCAHGFYTMEEDTEAVYLVSAYYAPEFERGIRWDDPAFNISWPDKPNVLSEKDQHHPYYEHSFHWC